MFEWNIHNHFALLLRVGKLTFHHFINLIRMMKGIEETFLQRSKARPQSYVCFEKDKRFNMLRKMPAQMPSDQNGTLEKHSFGRGTFGIATEPSCGQHCHVREELWIIFPKQYRVEGPMVVIIAELMQPYMVQLAITLLQNIHFLQIIISVLRFRGVQSMWQ